MTERPIPEEVLAEAEAEVETQESDAALSPEDQLVRQQWRSEIVKLLNDLVQTEAGANLTDEAGPVVLDQVDIDTLDDDELLQMVLTEFAAYEPDDLLVGMGLWPEWLG